PLPNTANIDLDKLEKMNVEDEGGKFEILFRKDNKPRVEKIYSNFSKATKESSLYKQTKEIEKDNEIIKGLNRSRNVLHSTGSRLKKESETDEIGLKSLKTKDIYDYLIKKG